MRAEEVEDAASEKRHYADDDLGPMLCEEGVVVTLIHQFLIVVHVRRGSGGVSRLGAATLGRGPARFDLTPGAFRRCGNGVSSLDSFHVF